MLISPSAVEGTGEGKSEIIGYIKFSNYLRKSNYVVTLIENAHTFYLWVEMDTFWDWVTLMQKKK